MTAALLAVPAAAQRDAAPASPAELVKSVDIPYDRFTLANGLEVIVHEDRKAPVVAVSIWYGVGSKHEPVGKTGYAHLFEHIMFNGSEHAPGDYFEYLKQVGATDFNGTTWYDRTNYFQTVPTSALESVLFLESDRMGWLLGGLTQEKLANQIGVVQNEKRQSDNQPFGLVDYKQTELLYPATHPYGHTTIGSMADLSAATLDDMRRWFTGHYGPNNAVLVIAGDIDVQAARPLVEKWFAGIGRGPELPKLSPPLPVLAEPVKAVMKDQVPVTRIYRNWLIPGIRDDEHLALGVAAKILGGLASSRLDNILVRGEQNAVAAYAYTLPLVEAGVFEIGVDVKPGIEADVVATRLDLLIADFLSKGPSADEVQRAVTRDVAEKIAGLEQVGGFGGKAVTLAEGALYLGDPGFYRRELDALVKITPEEVRTTAQKWLSKPFAELRVEPGQRDSYGEAKITDAAPSAKSTKPAAVAVASPVDSSDRRRFPAAGETPDIDFPSVETTKLKNGMSVFLARRSTVPVVRMAISFDAGYASDPAGAAGTNALMIAMLDEGTSTLDATRFAEAQERLGASIGVTSSLDRTVLSAQAMTANLAPTVMLLADFAQNPAFDAKELERVRVQQLTRIKAEMAEPAGIARRTLPGLIYGTQHPYGRAGSGLGEADVVARLTAADLATYHRDRLRPETADIYIVGDTDLATMRPLLEKAFGDWKAPRGAAPAKNLTAAVPPSTGRIVVIDRPNSPQSYIYAGKVLGTTGKDDLLVLDTANDIMGGDFLSRINMDLRETKGWSYGSRSGVNQPLGQSAFIVRAPVQTDRTGDAILAIRQQMRDFTGSRPVTTAERDRTVMGKRLEMAGQFEQGSAVLAQMQEDRLYGRPFDYVETLAARYATIDAAALGMAMRDAVDPETLTWVVVGDAARIRPQLANIDMAVEYRAAPAASPGETKEDEPVQEETP